MTNDINQLIRAANRKSVIENQRALYESRFKLLSRYSFNGGTFQVTPELIMYVEHLLKEVTTDVIIDDRNRPILVENLSEFLFNIKACYREAVNEFYHSYKRLTEAKNTEEILSE